MADCGNFSPQLDPTPQIRSAEICKAPPMRLCHITLFGLLVLSVACGAESDTSSPDRPVTNTGETPSDSPPTSSPDGTATGPPTHEDARLDAVGGVYIWESASGAVVRYTIPARSDYDIVADIELYRTDIGSDLEASYILAEIDNTTGSENTQIPDLRIVTQDGETVVYQKAWLLIGDWQNDIPLDETDLYNRGVNLYNSLLDRDFALPGARVTTVLASSSALPSIGRVFATVGFEDPIEISKE